MNMLKANSTRQLGIALRLLLAELEDPRYIVEIKMNQKEKIEFRVYFKEVDEERYAEICKKYLIQIS